jgi:hypothetical protein
MTVRPKIDVFTLLEKTVCNRQIPAADFFERVGVVGESCAGYGVWSDAVSNLRGLGVLGILGVLGVLGVLGILSVLGVLGVLGVFGFLGVERVGHGGQLDARLKNYMRACAVARADANLDPAALSLGEGADAEVDLHGEQAVLNLQVFDEHGVADGVAASGSVVQGELQVVGSVSGVVVILQEALIGKRSRRLLRIGASHKAGGCQHNRNTRNQCSSHHHRSSSVCD